MSRIAGVVDGRATELLGTSLASLTKRAEWKQETVARAGCTLGWTGQGPARLASAEGTIVALDGRVYNRTELGARADESDAALLARLCERRTVDEVVARLNGDFALAVWQEAEQALWLARDRFGLKPLYYALLGDGGAAFASQPGGLLALPGVAAALDRRYVAVYAASHYRAFDNELERSPYADVAQVAPAHTVRLQRGSTAARRYWQLEPDVLVADEDELAERYRALLLDAVAIRVERAHRPSFTLSGGLDSSSVLACATRARGPQAAFSAVYDDPTFDESHEIRPMLEEAVSEWHPVSIGTPDVFGIVERLVDLHDEPVVTATWLSHYLVCGRAADSGSGSLFGGLGGDELNAGEYEYFPYHFADLRTAGREDELTREIELWAAHHDHPIYRKGVHAAEAALARLVDLSHPGRCLPDRQRLERYAAALDPGFFDLRTVHPILDEPFDSYLANRAYQDLSRETLPPCLRAEDRHGTAHGLETFLPFLDHRLVEFMFSVPGSLKIRDGVTKRLLRTAMRGILPEETRTRVAKMGWNAPAHRWFSGEGGDLLIDLVHSQRFRERGIYDVAEVERLVAEHERIVATGDPRENHMMFLWQLVNLELWLQSLERRYGSVVIR